jgi:hypothetical protein
VQPPTHSHILRRRPTKHSQEDQRPKTSLHLPTIANASDAAHAVDYIISQGCTNATPEQTSLQLITRRPRPRTRLHTLLVLKFCHEHPLSRQQCTRRRYSNCPRFTPVDHRQARHNGSAAVRNHTCGLQPRRSCDNCTASRHSAISVHGHIPTIYQGSCQSFQPAVDQRPKSPTTTTSRFTLSSPAPAALTHQKPHRLLSSAPLHYHPRHHLPAEEPNSP